MATAVPTNTDLECSICTEVFNSPKMLSCGHSFCRDCLERWIDCNNKTFPCPVCKKNIKIPRGGVDKFPTNFSLQTLTDSTSPKPKHYCPNHNKKKKEVEYYCQTCNLGLCSKCIYTDHNDHITLDLESDSTRENVVQQLSKHEQFLKKKIEDLELTRVTLLETSENLKSFCDEACTKISEKTENIIGELKENCVKIRQEIRDHFEKNESKMAKTQQTVMTQIKNIETDLDASRPTTEKPTLTLIYSLPKLQELQKLCENTKTDIPPVTYLEWKEGGVNVCDMFGSTVTKQLYQSSEGSGPIVTVTKALYRSSEGSGPISTATKPLYQSSESSGPISTVTKPLYQSSESSGPISTVTKPLYQCSEGNIFKFNYKDIVRSNKGYVSKDKHTSHGIVWSCSLGRSSIKNILLDTFIARLCNEQPVVYINTEFLPEDNPQLESCEIEYTTTLLKKKEDTNVMSNTMTQIIRPEYYRKYDISIPWDTLTDPSAGFIDTEGQFLVRFDLHQVLNVTYK